MSEFLEDIPTYDAKTATWSTTSFSSRADFVAFLWSIWKEPGKYDFDETSLIFNQESSKFRKEGIYCRAPVRTKDYVDYWDDQKQKCRKGVIFYGTKGQTWFLNRDYYMWLNFLPIYNKEVARFTFADVRDAQYHMSLYEALAEWSYRHGAILKKRQIASSYYHAGKMINLFWFEEGAMNKMAGSLKDYVNEKGTWRFLEEYRNFLNEHTAWYRPCNPDKVLNWEQKVEVNTGGRKTDRGLKSVLIGLSLDKDPTNGVGGPCVTPYTSILCENNEYKFAKDITLNDRVIGADGKLKKVLHLFKGSTEMYSITQSKGVTYTVTGDHTLYLYDTTHKKHVTIKAKEFNALSKDRKRFLKGIKFDGAEGKDINLPVSPYYLGLYLGDGCKYDGRITVNKTKDPEIFEAIYNIAETEGYLISQKLKNKYRTDYKDEMYDMALSSGYDVKTMKPALLSLFKKLGVQDKNIPSIYLKSSKKQRLELLAGIIDTDGYYSSKKNRYELHVKSPKLTDDIIDLCVSVGLDAHYYHIVEDNKSSTVVSTTTYGYRIRITGDLTKVPCKIARKKAVTNGIKNKNRYSTITVTPVGIGDYNGFECEDNLFILKDGTITHNCKFFFHEEAGIAPKMNETIEYLLPALKSGMIYTGMFIAAGSVGDLEQCEPLKEMIFNPDAKDVLKVETNLVDSKGTIKECGLFIPEQWSMLPCIDKYGNSQVEEALKMIMQERAQWKKDMKPDDYQLRISQKPTNIEEAFAYRKESKFPQHLVTQQIRRIEEKEYFYEHLKLERNSLGKIDAKETRKLPISEFPLSTTAVDKEGCLVVWERPVKDAPWGTYYASMDPVRDGKTTTSKSLCSLIIYKNPLEVTTHKMDGTVEHVIEQDKIVASWCGRFDDINDTHRFCELIIEWYNAWTLCENNVTGFIQYMIGQRKQKYLVPKNQIAFLKDLGSNTNVFQDYGWRNVGTIFKTNLIEYGIQFLNEKIDESVDPEGNILSIRYGVERIPDIMILKEMQAYREGINVDRLVSYCALVAFAKVQQTNRGVARKTEHENEESKQMSNNMSKLNMTPFRNMGRQRTVVDDKYKVSRSPYKNYK